MANAKNSFLIKLAVILLVLCLSAFAMISCSSTPDNSDGGDGDGSDETPSLDEILGKITGDNVFVVTYVDNGNGSITATVSVAGTVSLAGFAGTLKYDSSALTVKSCAPGSLTVNTATAGEISFSYAQTTNYTTVGQLFTVDFSYSGTVNTTLDLSITEAANASLADVPFTAQDATVEIK